VRGKAKPDQAAGSTDQVTDDDVREAVADDTATAPGPADPADTRSPDPQSPDPQSPDTGSPADASPAAEAEAEVVEAEVVDEKTAAEQPAPTVEAEVVEEGGGALGAELGALRSDLDEMTRDLQRVSAEYANYRRRVERDRSLAAEQGTGAVLAALLPVLDDLDRARDHGDLKGPFGTVAEQLLATLGKFGLVPFGEKGDTFDPTQHEAVAHQTSAEVTEPTCVEVMRRGYMLGERLLRPALVAVADPE
jgi:molecular chaperone GrpE